MKLILQAIKALFRKTEASVEAVRSEIPTKLSDLDIDMDVGGGGLLVELKDDQITSHPFETIKNAVLSGQNVICFTHDDVGYDHIVFFSLSSYAVHASGIEEIYFWSHYHNIRVIVSNDYGWIYEE